MRLTLHHGSQEFSRSQMSGSRSQGLGISGSRVSGWHGQGGGFGLLVRQHQHGSKGRALQGAIAPLVQNMVGLVM